MAFLIIMEMGGSARYRLAHALAARVVGIRRCGRTADGQAVVPVAVAEGVSRAGGGGVVVGGDITVGVVGQVAGRTAGIVRYRGDAVSASGIAVGRGYAALNPSGTVAVIVVGV